jgi:hypothetical protein
LPLYISYTFSTLYPHSSNLQCLEKLEATKIKAPEKVPIAERAVQEAQAQVSALQQIVLATIPVSPVLNTNAYVLVSTYITYFCGLVPR